MYPHPGVQPDDTAMGITIQTPGVHHVALRVSNYDRARRFYIDTPGFEVVMEAPHFLLFFAGQTAIAIRGPEAKTPAGDRFNPFRVGLDHIALACTDENELNRVALALERVGIENTGVKLDETLTKSTSRSRIRTASHGNSTWRDTDAVCAASATVSALVRRVREPRRRATHLL